MSFSSQHHSFDIALAAYYGVECAILIHHFQHWVRVNRFAKRNIKEGKCWTYQTRLEIQAHFPYWSFDEVRRLCEKLVEKGVLITDNFNKSKVDKTLWYAFANERAFGVDEESSKKFYERQNCLSKGKSAFPEGKTATPIPDSKPYSKTEDKEEGPPINPPQRGDAEAKPPIFPEPPKRKKLKEEYMLREERVYTTDTQHKKLLSMASDNESLVQEWYKRLSKWKIGSGIDGGRFDFNSINKWVISAVEKEKNTSQNNSFSSKSTSTLNDTQQRNFDENKQIVEEIKLAMPEKPISIWYKNHILKGPGFDISMLVDPNDLVRYLSKKLNMKINYEEDHEESYD